MPTQPVRQLLDRDGAISNAKEILATGTPYFQELVNYGTYILDKSVNSEFGKKISGIAPLALFRQILENTDAFEVLFSNCCTYPIEMILRGTFEALVSLEYIIESESTYPNRSLCFVFSFYKDQINSLKLIEPNSIEKQQLKEKLSRDKLINRDPFVEINNIEDRISEMNEFLAADEFKPIIAEYDNYLKNKENQYVNWYSLFNGPGTFKKLANNVGYPALYTILYGLWSRRIHAKDIFSFFSSTKTGSSPIRDASFMSMYSPFWSEFFIKATKLIINKFLPDEDFEAYLNNEPVILSHQLIQH